MQIHTVYTGSPEDIATAVAKSLQFMIDQIVETHSRKDKLPSLLSIAHIAEDCSCGRETVRKWIVEGRRLPGQSKRIQLKVVGGLTEGRHLVRRKDYEDFLNQFPSIRA